MGIFMKKYILISFTVLILSACTITNNSTKVTVLKDQNSPSYSSAYNSSVNTSELKLEIHEGGINISEYRVATKIGVEENVFVLMK